MSVFLLKLANVTRELSRAAEVFQLANNSLIKSNLRLQFLTRYPLQAAPMILHIIVNLCRH